MTSGLYKPLGAGEGSPVPPRVAPAPASTCSQWFLLRLCSRKPEPGPGNGSPTRRLPRVALDTAPSTGHVLSDPSSGVLHLGAGTCGVSSPEERGFGGLCFSGNGLTKHWRVRFVAYSRLTCSSGSAWTAAGTAFANQFPASSPAPS